MSIWRKLLSFSFLLLTMSALSCRNMLTYSINPIRFDRARVTRLSLHFRLPNSHRQYIYEINLDKASKIKVPQEALYTGFDYSGNGNVYLCENFGDYQYGGVVDVVIYIPFSIKINDENQYYIDGASPYARAPAIAYFLDRVVDDRVVTTLSKDFIFNASDHFENISFTDAIGNLDKDVSLLLPDRQPMFSYLNESQKHDAGFILLLKGVYYWIN